MRIVVLVSLIYCSLLGQAVAQLDSFAMQRALQRYSEAYGGGRDADALTSVSIEGTQEQDGQVYDFLLRKKRPDSIRYRLSLGDTKVVTAYDGTTAWMQTTEEGKVFTRKLTVDERDALKREASFESPLFRHLEKRGNQVEMTGRQFVEGRDAYIFEVKEADGQRSRYYLDVREPHVLKHERISKAGAVEVAVFYRNYKKVDGYPFAFEVETFLGDQTVSLVKIESISANPGLLSFYFRMPKS